MPKGGTLTFPVEPQGVLDATGYLLRRDPYAPDTLAPFIAAMDPELRKAKEVEYWHRVADATMLMLGWLNRRNRLAKPYTKVNICLPRETVTWLGGFDLPKLSRGGLFGASSPAQSIRSQAADIFFFRCRMASSRKMGRPRLTPDQAAKRLQQDAEMADSTYWRMAARSGEQDHAQLSALLAKLIGKKLPTL